MSTAEFFLAMISLLFRGEQGINWVGCGPSSPGQISSPDTTFFKMKMASPAIRLFEEYPGKVNLLFSAPLGCKFYALGLIGKWALKYNKWDVIIKTGQ